MAVRFEQFNEIGVFTPNGDLRGSEAVAEFRKVVSDAIDSTKVAKIAVDCSAVRFIDSAALETLLAFRTKLGDSIGAVRLTNLDANCRKILEITRLDSRFEIHADLNSALKAINTRAA